MSAITNNSAQVKASLIQKYPLIAFFVLAFGLTWIFMIMDALGSHNILPFRLPLPLMIVMGYMPTLAAVIVTNATKGRDGVHALLKKLLIARVGSRWYLFAIFGFGVVSVAAIMLYNLLGGSPAVPILSKDIPPFSGPFQFVFNIVTFFIIIGIVNGEELAWRGFALPRLQAKYNALTSSIILGVLWALFHLPLFFTLTGSSQADESPIGFLLSTVSLAILYTWMYNHTRGSVLMAYLFHAAANTWTRVFSIDHGNATVGWILTSLIALTAVIVVMTTGAQNLSRTHARIQEEN